MRYIAPERGTVESSQFEQAPLRCWSAHADWLQGSDWPSIDALNAVRPETMAERFVAQTSALLNDGLHYEQRIAERGEIATRESNWHDLFNALIGLRHGRVKRELNAGQVGEIAHMGPRDRSRAQYAMTHFDEAGVLVMVRDPGLLDLWDAHDWHGLFWRERAAWIDGRISVEVFGHALLEHALTPGKLLVGKALAFLGDASAENVESSCAKGIRAGQLLRDPLDLRPLPLSGIPGWHPDNRSEAFHRDTPCYQPRRSGREYPAPTAL